MPFNVGDVVRIKNNNALRSGTARVQRVLPRTMSVQDFQEYVGHLREMTPFGRARAGSQMGHP